MMKYYDNLFLYEIMARAYFHAELNFRALGDDLNADRCKADGEANMAKADAFVQIVTGHTRPGCAPPKKPPCRWPDTPCDADTLVCIEAKYIKDIDIILPSNDSNSYSILIKNLNGNVVVDYNSITTKGNIGTHKYNEHSSLISGEMYTYEITINYTTDVKTIISYPFKIKP